VGHQVMSKAQSKVWAVLQSERNMESNLVPLSQAEIAEAAGLHHLTVLRAIKELVSRDLLRRRGNCRMVLNPLVIWKGKWDDMLASHEKYKELAAPENVISMVDLET